MLEDILIYSIAILVYAIIFALIAGFIVSVVLFIKDGRKAKKQNTKRQTGVTAFFILMTSLFVILLLITAAIIYLASTAMVGM